MANTSLSKNFLLSKFNQPKKEIESENQDKIVTNADIFYNHGKLAYADEYRFLKGIIHFVRTQNFPKN